MSRKSFKPFRHINKVFTLFIRIICRKKLRVLFKRTVNSQLPDSFGIIFATESTYEYAKSSARPTSLIAFSLSSFRKLLSEQHGLLRIFQQHNLLLPDAFQNRNLRQYPGIVTRSGLRNLSKKKIISYRVYVRNLQRICHDTSPHLNLVPALQGCYCL